MTRTRPDRWYDESGPSDNTQVKVRVNAQHRAAFKTAARQAGKSVSTWMRDLALQEIQRLKAESAQEAA